MMPFDDANFSRIGNVLFLFFKHFSYSFTPFQLGAAVLDTESSNSKWNIYLPQNQPELSAGTKAGSLSHTQTPKSPIGPSFLPYLVLQTNFWLFFLNYGGWQRRAVFMPPIQPVFQSLSLRAMKMLCNLIIKRTENMVFVDLILTFVKNLKIII